MNDPDSLEALLNIPLPRDVKQLEALRLRMQTDWPPHILNDEERRKVAHWHTRVGILISALS